MADFFLTTSSNVAQTLAFADSGVVAQGVTLFSSGSTSPVTMTASARLTALGAVVSENAATLNIAATTIAATVNVGQGGNMISMLNAAILGSVVDQFFLNNAGTIQGFAEAVNLTAAPGAGTGMDFHVVNSGTIQSNGDQSGENTMEFSLTGLIQIANSGLIMNGGIAGGIRIGSGTLNFGNSGTLQVAVGANAVETTGGDDIISNTGTIQGNLILGDGADEVINTGTILGAVAGEDGSDRLVNRGQIVGDVLMNDVANSGPLSDVVINAGVITGDVLLGNASDTFRSKGGVVQGLVDGGAGDDTYFIDGTIEIVDSSGNDLVVSTVDYAMDGGIERLVLRGDAGLIGRGNFQNNQISGTDFSDTLLGGDGNDELRSFLGDNQLYGGRGNDAILASGENDLSSGGSGNDVISVSAGNHTVQGGSGSDLLDLFNAELGSEVNLATGAGRLGLDGAMVISGIENLSGSAFGDVLTGNANANRLFGDLGDDVIRGGSGNDSIFGGDGIDDLTGGGGADRFVFQQASDSGQGSPDTITDFNAAQDLIDLSALDADAGDPFSAFTFIGTGAFSGSKAEVRFFTDVGNNTTVIEVRTEGAVVNDMRIFLTGIHTLTADNFLL